MKVNGISLEGPNEALVVLPRNNGKDIAFKFKAILDYEPFHKLVPAVEVRMSRRPGRDPEPDLKNEEYLKLVGARNRKMSAWSFITSIAATPSLEWETVDPIKPDTWVGYHDELRKAGISEAEVNQLWGGFNEANGLSDDHRKQARDRFLQQEAEAKAPKA